MCPNAVTVTALFVAFVAGGITGALCSSISYMRNYWMIPKDKKKCSFPDPPNWMEPKDKEK